MKKFQYDDRRTSIFCLIGYNILYSFSKQYFIKKFNKENIIHSRYEIFDLPIINCIECLLRRYINIQGINITIPYKRTIIQYINCLSNDAFCITAVNTINFKDNSINGCNTDTSGFKKSYLKYLQFTNGKSIIIGNGGAALAVIYALQQLKIPYLIISLKNYSFLKKKILKRYKITVQCTPLGTYTSTYKYPLIHYHLINKYNYFYDLIYNPQISKFLKKGIENITIVKNGLEMLQIQAELAWYLWNNII